MARTILHHDIETRSACDLTVCGQYAYGSDPTTEVLTFSWALGDGPISTWFVFDGAPMPAELRDAMLDPEVKLGAHNASFERVLHLTSPIRRQTYLPAAVVKAIRPLGRWNCTAARAAYMGLPRTLEKASNALGLSESKDLEGAKLMKRMCRPVGTNPDGTYQWFMNPPVLGRLASYCEQDVAVERRIDGAIPDLPVREREVWEATERMNDRGVRVDDELLMGMVVFVAEAEGHVNRNIRELTDGFVPRVSNNKRMLDWLHEKGIERLPSGAPVNGVNKAVIREILDIDGLPGNIREVLETKRDGNKSSASKYKSILSRLNRDKRLRGSLVYCGAASTHRFSSRGTQLQNLPRGGTIKNVDEALSHILDGASAEYIADHFGGPMTVASELIRPTFIAPPGMWLARGDYAQVELRANAFLAGESHVLRAFRDYDTVIGFDEAKRKPLRKGPDIYVIAAAGINRISYDAVDDTRRQHGKVAELACIAEGQLALTDQGYVPIQNVTPQMRVWDGENWVPHGGVVYRGVRDTIFYQGLRATPDHLVWTERATEPLEFGKAASCGARLLRPRTARKAIRMGASHLREAQLPAQNSGPIRVYDILNAGPLHRFTVSDVLVHNCGFGGGKGAFQAFARLYGVKMPEDQAQGIVDGWRASHPMIVQFWQDLEDCALACMRGRPGEKHIIRTIRKKPKHGGRPVNPGLWFVRGRSALVLRLPSGNCLFYWYPKIVTRETAWGPRDSITYMAEDSQTKVWKRWDAWGGIFCENAVQSFARDIMARSLVRMDDAGLDPVLTVHDEGIGQIPFDVAPKASAAAEMVRAMMMVTEDWFEKMPLAVDASAGLRYIKA